MIKNIIIILLTIILISSCDKSSKPEFFVMRTGDFDASCSSLKKEKIAILGKIENLQAKIKVKSVRNTTLFYLAPITLFTSLFFADFSGAEKEQISLYQDRITHLGDISALKCPT